MEQQQTNIDNHNSARGSCKMPTLALVIPCYNEQEVIKITVNRLLEKINEMVQVEIIASSSFLYIVDDGSTDSTWQIIESLHNENKNVKGLKFTKNFGNQNAILAGLHGAREHKADCVITIDADLQQDENLLPEFIEKYKSGADVVFGIRNGRETDSFLKKWTALLFYSLMKLLGANINANHSEYRLVSRKSLDILSQYKEYSLFLRGIFNELGLKHDFVYFKVKPRKAGKSKFNWFSLMTLALNGITSFSVVPLRMVSILGMIMALIGFGVGLEVLYEKFFLANTIPGWTTIVVTICFFSGVQVFCLGIIGEYLGQVYREVKARPRYIKDVELG